MLQSDNDNMRSDISKYKRKVAEYERKLALFEESKVGCKAAALLPTLADSSSY